MKKHIRMQLILFIYLCAFTACCVAWLPAYTPIQKTWTAGTRGWQAYGPSQEVQLKNGVVSVQTFIQNNKDSGAWKAVPMSVFANGKIYVSGRVRTKNVLRGPKESNTAKLILVPYHKQKAIHSAKQTVIKLTGSRDWQPVHGAFTIPPEADAVRLLVELSKCTGIIEVKHLQLVSVKTNAAYTWAKALFLGGWAVFFILSLWMLYQVSHGWIRLLSMATVFCILIAVSISGPIKAQIYQWGMTHLSILRGLGLYAGDTITMDKYGHFLMFALLGFFWGCSRRVSIIYQLAYILMLAIGSECIQIFILGRSPMVMDTAFDIMGGMAGLVFAWIFRGLFLPRRRPEFPLENRV